MSDRFRGALTSAWQRIEERQWIYGKPGKLNVDTSYTYAVPGRAKFIYVTIRNAGGAQTAVPARNDALVPSDNTVVVKMKLEKGVYVIYGVSGRPEQGGTLPENTGGNYSFLELTDVPAAYTGAAGSLLSVNGTEDGVEFTPFPDADDIDESATRLWFDPAEAVKLAGIESLADVTDQANVAAAIDGSTEATAFADPHKLATIVSSTLRWISGTTLKASLKTYFDTLYGLLGSANTWTAVNTFNNNLIAKHFRGQYSGGTDFAFYTGTNLEVMANAYWDGSNYKRYVTGKASKLVLDDDGTIYLVNTNTSAAADANITDFTIRGRFLPTGQLDVQAGNSADVARVGGVMNAQATFVSNALTAETNLHVYTVPANTLASVGDEIVYEAHGIFAATANGKTARLYVNGTVVATETVSTNGGTWFARIVIARYDSGNVRVFTTFTEGTTAPSTTTHLANANVAVTFSSTFVIGVTGQSASGGGEIASEFASVKYYPVNT